MRDKDARAEIAALKVRVQVLEGALTAALQEASRLQTLGAMLSEEFVKVAGIMSNADAYYAALLEVQGRGLRGYAALEVFQSARDRHKAAFPNLHDAETWRRVPEWMLVPGDACAVSIQQEGERAAA